MNEEYKDKLIYILPNFFTASSVFLAVVSIISTINEAYAKAIFFIILSLIFDGLDGRVARLTNTTSKFGVEFDSLADIVAFGVAPGILFYCVIGQDLGRFGTLITALYIVFGAIRLARFNVTTGTYEPNVFIGLPIPTAAVTLAFSTGIYLKYPQIQNFNFLFIFGTIMLSILMVSNIRFPSFKKINLKNANFIKVLVILIISFSLLYLAPLESTLFITTIYIFYGVIRAIYIFSTKKAKR